MSTALKYIQSIKSLPASKKLIAGLSAGGLIVIILLVVLFAGMRGGPMPPGSQQPKVQARDLNMLQNIVERPPMTVLGAPRVSNSYIFDYNASFAGPGRYSLVFDNKFSSTTENISLSYYAAGKSQSYIEILPSGASISITHDLSTKQRINGQFTLSGGSPNDIGFSMTAQTCTHSIGFNFTLVNDGTANGNATVRLLGDGISFWQHTYLVRQGQHLPESGSVFLSDCVEHTYSVEVTALEKA
ncbi:MAG TPA: hypothetical protein VGS11_05520 [Candidatus Bathyarchaeia archaeon]|nr:hypothetical protein [Candidatus Bathyarchaeia archaeon]